LLHGLELLVNTADINCFVTFNIAVSQVFSDLFYFFPDTTDLLEEFPEYAVSYSAESSYFCS